MRLDHISYVASHDELINVVQRMGANIGSAFIDGGIHPRFGTRNFTLPLANGHYLEVLCPLEHPAADTSPFGQVVTQRAKEGGGWLTWVISMEDLSPVEDRLNRKAVDGSRKRPDGTELRWKQLGVLGTLEDSQLPFFIQWLTSDHPSTERKAIAKISKIEMSGDESKIENWVGTDLSKTFDGVEIVWVDSKDEKNQTGIIAVHLSTPNGNLRID